MNNRNFLMSLPKEKLAELAEMYSKNWLAMDGVWFQSVERKFGMDEAMYHDVEAWKRFTVTEARRIKNFLHLEDGCGLEGLEKALSLRFYANLGEYGTEFKDGALYYTSFQCRVQDARGRKGMPLHPCKEVGVIEYGGFAKTIDPRIRCECVSCYTDITDAACSCKWKFTLDEGEDMCNEPPRRAGRKE